MKWSYCQGIGMDNQKEKEKYQFLYKSFDIFFKISNRRESNMTDVIVYCDSDYHSCTGTADKGYCAQGYIGPLCETCDNNGKMWGE